MITGRPFNVILLIKRQVVHIVEGSAWLYRCYAPYFKDNVRQKQMQKIEDLNQEISYDKQTDQPTNKWTLSAHREGTLPIIKNSLLFFSLFINYTRYII